MIIRYSLLNDFLSCPAAFYRRHILHETEFTKSSALEFGSALHLGIRTILNGEDGIAPFCMYWDSLKDVDMVYYRYGWQELRDLAVNKFLPNFQRLHAKKFSDFQQELEMSMPFLDGHTLQGTTDYVGNYEGNLTVADWKTSSTEYKRMKIEKNPQLYIYCKLYEHNFGKLPKQVVYKVFRKDNGSIQTLKKELTIAHISAIFTSVENSAKAMLRMIETKEIYHGNDCYCKEL